MLASAAAAPAATPRRGLLRAPRLGRRRAAPSAFLAPSVLPPSRDAPGSRPPSSSGARVALGRRAPAPVPGFARASPRPRTLVPPVSAPGATSTEVAGDAPDASSADSTESSTAASSDASSSSSSSSDASPSCRIDRGLGLRRALSDETQSRPFLPLGGEVLHVGWLRGGDPSSVGKVTREEGESDRECLEALVDHYTGDDLDRAQELLRRVERGWADVTLTLGGGYYCRLQRFSEFDTLTLSGPGDPEAPLDRPLQNWQRMIPPGWLATVPGRVFLCAHVVVRNVDPPPSAETKPFGLYAPDSLEPRLSDYDLWNELRTVSNAVGWEKRAADGGYGSDTSAGAAQQEALEAIAALERERVELEASGSSVDELDAEVAELRDAARRAGVKVVEAGRGGSDRPKDRPSSSGSSSGSSSSAGSSSGSSASSRSVPAEWQTWGTQVESNRIVAWASRGARFYANYHLDEEGGMTCLLLSPRGASVISAARQLWRYFTIEQYRLLILSRLPGAKSRYPTLAKLNARYESVAQAIRRMNKSEQDVETRNWFRRVGRKVRSFWKNDGKARYKVQQQFLETITDLEQSTAQELARAKSEATTAHAYHEIIQTRFEEADFRPLGGEVRFLPPFVKKRLDPAISTINSVAERAQILSDALERTTGLLQAGVEVRLQRLNEIITRLGLVFTVLSVVLGFFSAVAYEGPLQRAFYALCRAALAKFPWTSPLMTIMLPPS